MKILIRLFLVFIFTLNLKAIDLKKPTAQEAQPGLSTDQMEEIRAIMRQTQELAKEQMGEDVFNNAMKEINAQTQDNFKIDPLSANQAQAKQAQPSQGLGLSANETQELSQDELELMRSAIKNQDLKALQRNFHNKKYTGFENTQQIIYEKGKTHKIRTRQAMATTLIFDSNIENFILGDQNGFKVEIVPNKINALSIIPQLIGIDTSLTIFTNDGNVHTFYLYSTSYKNLDNPSFIITIKDNNKENQKELEKLKQAQKQKEYLTIEDGIAKIDVKRSEIYRGYIQKAKKENEWLLSAEIFNDKKFTFFKYPKDEMPQIPTIFAVIDKQDSPVETRVIGDYIIAETINPKFIIKSGNSYVCVQRQETDEEKQRKQIRKNLNQDEKAVKQRQKSQEKRDEAINKARGI